MGVFFFSFLEYLLRFDILFLYVLIFLCFFSIKRAAAYVEESVCCFPEPKILQLLELPVVSVCSARIATEY